jgi:hypothetical protein
VCVKPIVSPLFPLCCVPLDPLCLVGRPSYCIFLLLTLVATSTTLGASFPAPFLLFYFLVTNPLVLFSNVYLRKLGLLCLLSHFEFLMSISTTQFSFCPLMHPLVFWLLFQPLILLWPSPSPFLSSQPPFLVSRSPFWPLTSLPLVSWPSFFAS